jgi:hypothetical protein
MATVRHRCFIACDFVTRTNAVPDDLTWYYKVLDETDRRPYTLDQERQWNSEDSQWMLSSAAETRSCFF